MNSRPAPTEYFVSLADGANHLAHVSVRLHEDAATHTLNLPVWNALYQVRNFAANVENVRAQDSQGMAAKVVQRKPSEWQVSAPAGCVVVSYGIHLNSSGPFGSVLGSDRGFFNWAMVLMYSPSMRTQPVSIRLLDVPATWQMRDVHVLGHAAPGHVEQALGVAQNYDELVDSPAEMGTFREAQFQQDGAKYHIVVQGDTGDYDIAKLQETVARITHAGVNWMQDRPYDEYTFLYHFPRGPGGGGMEHAYGTAIELSSSQLRPGSRGIASVSAHEYFHLWNVKRIRPQSLEPIDYQQEMDTRALWFSEGVTSTVGNLLLARSGVIDEYTYVMSVSSAIAEYEQRPAHHWQSVEESSLDAWLEGNAFYRSPERSISYYNKGELLGVLLDLRIRQLTNDRKSLRDLFQQMNQQYAKQNRFFPDSEGVEKSAENVTGQSFSDFFEQYVAGVEEIPYDEFFSFVGLRVVRDTSQIGNPGFETTANLGAQPEVSSVEKNSDAQRAGIVVGDRITTLNGNPASASLDYELASMKPGSIAHLQVEGRAGKRQIDLKLGARSDTAYLLQDLPVITPEQRAHRTAWIHGDDEAGPSR